MLISAGDWILITSSFGAICDCVLHIFSSEIDGNECYRSDVHFNVIADSWFEGCCYEKRYYIINPGNKHKVTHLSESEVAMLCLAGKLIKNDRLSY